MMGVAPLAPRLVPQRVATVATAVRRGCDG